MARRLGLVVIGVLVLSSLGFTIGSPVATRPAVAGGMQQAAAQPAGQSGTQPAAIQSNLKPRFGNLRFSSGATEDNQPSALVTELPSGSTRIYLFFDYENMRNGLTWEARWYRNDQYIESASIQPRPWRGGPRGTWWISILNARGLADGTYRVELYIKDEKQSEASIQSAVPVVASSKRALAASFSPMKSARMDSR